jgi:hypothetical protein
MVTPLREQHDQVADRGPLVCPHSCALPVIEQEADIRLDCVPLDTGALARP